jgi:hypothetical protein
MKANKEWEANGRETSMPEGITVRECVEYIGKAIGSVDKKAFKRYRAGEAMTVQETKNASILTGRSITAIRRLKKLLGCLLVAMLLSVAPMAHAQDGVHFYVNGVDVHPHVGGVPIGNMPVGELLDNVKHIRVGFTTDQVTAWIGHPARVNRTIDADGIVNRWSYETANLNADGQWRVRSAIITFSDDRVVTINYEKAAQ